jgi:AsmA protein
MISISGQEGIGMVKSKRKVLWIAGGVCLAVAVLIILVLLFGAGAIKSRVEAIASKTLKMDVRVGARPSVSLFPVFGASLADVTVKNGGADVATVAHMKVGLKLLPLIWGKVKISRLELVKPVISIVRQKDGTLNIKMRGKPSGKRVALKKLAISEGNLLFTDLRSGGKTECEGVDITVRDLSAGGTPGGDPLKTLSLTGDFRCRAIHVGNFALADLAMKAAGAGGVIDVSQATRDVLGGTGSGTLHADFTGTTPHFRIITVVSRLKIQDLLQESPNAKSMEGLADLSADLTASGKSALEMKQSLSGQVSLSGENIVLNGLDIDDLISSLQRSRRFSLVDVGAFFLAGPLGPVLNRGYRFADLYKESRGGNGIIAKLVSVWKVGNGVAEAVDVAMATKERRIAMKGRLNLIDNRFEDAVVAVLDENGCAVLTQKVHGSFSSPEISNISILRSLTRPVTNLLKSVVKLFDRGPCDVFYSGSVASPEHNKRP